MTLQDDSTKHVCQQCIGDPFLTDEVQEKGRDTQCSYCQETDKAITLEELADRVHGVIQKYFHLVSPEPDDFHAMLMHHGIVGLWIPDGSPATDVITDIVGLCEEAANDVAELLAEKHDLMELPDGVTAAPYDDESLYEAKDIDDWDFQDTWASFRDEVRFHSRFFSNQAEEMLNIIFGDLPNHKTVKSEPVIHEIDPDQERFFVWRARQVRSSKEIEAILKAPAREIGPPPTRRAKGGRMNAPGIRVFYGAMEKATCLAEIRAPAGSYVVIGRFELTKPLRLLNMTALEEIEVQRSYFDPEYSTELGRAAFLRRLVAEISRPVTPQDEILEYLPTQAVAEYLTNKVTPPLDGIILRSSQTRDEGHNLVLFNHASGVEHDKPFPKTDLRVYIPRPDENGESNVFVFETTAPETATSPESTSTTTAGPIWIIDHEEQDDPEPFGQPTLRLDPESVAILHTRGVKYDYVNSTISRHTYHGRLPTVISRYRI